MPLDDYTLEIFFQLYSAVYITSFVYEKFKLFVPYISCKNNIRFIRKLGKLVRLFIEKEKR